MKAPGKLTVTRRPGEAVVIQLPDGRQIELVLLSARRERAGLLFIADTDILIYRKELLPCATVTTNGRSTARSNGSTTAPLVVPS